MRRRQFVLGLALAAGTRTAWGQATARQARLAFVHSGIPADRLTENGGTQWVRVFFEQLRRLGYLEGRNLTVMRYSGEGRPDRFADLTREVVSHNPDVIVANGPLVVPLKAATTTIPIVAVTVDPIRSGVAASLARPGANLTGVSVDAGIEVYGKQLQTFNETAPAALRIAYLSSRTDWEGMLGQELQEASQRLGIKIVALTLEAATPERFRDAFKEIARQHLDALIVSPAGELLANRQLIVDLAQASRLPGMYPYRDFVEAGGLMAYAPDLAELAGRLADQVRQILGGADPGNIPIFQATKFQLIVNLNTARAIGFTIPPAMLARVDEVIE